MDKENLILANKIYDEIMNFTSGKKSLAETPILYPMSYQVRDFLVECIDKKLQELENEFKQL